MTQSDWAELSYEKFNRLLSYYEDKPLAVTTLVSDFSVFVPELLSIMILGFLAILLE